METNSLANNLNSNNNIQSQVKQPSVDSKDTQIGLSTDFNHFIKMLITQLQCQDPTSPMETNDFTQQIVSFTGVEQAVKTNSHLEELVKINQGSQFNQAASFIDKFIKYDDNTSELTNGIGGNFRYTINKPKDGDDIVTTIVKVLDSNNNIVHKDSNGRTTPGIHSFNWDGIKNQRTNEKFPDGVYRLKVESYDSQGNLVEPGPSIHEGKVRETKIKNGSMILVLDDNKEIPLNKIISLKSDPNANINSRNDIDDDMADKIVKQLQKKHNLRGNE